MMPILFATTFERYEKKQNSFSFIQLLWSNKSFDALHFSLYHFLHSILVDCGHYEMSQNLLEK